MKKTQADYVETLLNEPGRPNKYCHAQHDGDCYWSGCPQNKYNEPQASGQHCPLDLITNEEKYE